MLAWRTGDAAQLLEAINIPTVAQLTGDVDWGANVWLAQAQIAHTRRQLELARTLLEKARPALTRPQAELYQRQVFAELDQALKTTSYS